MELINPSCLSFAGDFNTQMKEVINYIKISDEECKNRKKVMYDLNSVLASICEGSQMEEFGSRLTGLALKNSDIDCFVNIPQDVSEHAVQLVLRTQKALLKNEKFVNINVFTKTKIPKVNFQHRKTKICCDVTFSGRGALKNSLLLQYLISSDERIRPLMFIVKYWAKINKITGRRLMSNYCLILLVVFFLQKERILPTIECLQLNVEMEETDYWNTEFARVVNLNDNQKSVYNLLGDFFRFYSTLDFENNIISLYTGDLIRRKCFANVQDILSVYEIYWVNVREHNLPGLVLDSSFCIQDPFNHARNAGVTVKRTTAELIVQLMKNAASIYEHESDDYFLPKLLSPYGNKSSGEARQRQHTGYKNDL
ncbi:terminal uridylyltransferase cid1-like [Pieris napi]|uniref:terminal uridylyltransferase cid1-like n=1 Tax=Pieris napi TaxID=78633 RepID=UPI001FBA3B6F|nr:terminal uridylyltransferase cid1-like [Pieris napi]